MNYFTFIIHERLAQTPMDVGLGIERRPVGKMIQWNPDGESMAKSQDSLNSKSREPVVI